MLDISLKGKGAIKDKFDARNFRMDMVFGATSIPTEFDISDKVQWIKDQGSSGSCGGQAFSYHMEVLSYLRDGIYTKLSARDLYAPVHLNPEGSRAGDLLNQLANNGIAEESYMKSYANDGSPLNEFYMQVDRMRPNTDIDNIAMQYWVDKTYLTFESNKPEEVKKAILRGNGAVLAVLGNNACWTSKDGIISIPAQGTANWGHFIFLTGWKIIKNELYFKFVNSWGKEWGDGGFGYLPSKYLEAGLGFNAWVVTEYPRGKYGWYMKQITILKNLIALTKQLLGLK